MEVRIGIRRRTGRAQARCSAAAQVLIVLSLFLAGTGCATWAKHGVVLDSKKVRIAVMPVQNTLRIKRLKDIQTVPASAHNSLTNEAVLVSRQMHQATEEIGRYLATNLDRSYFFQVVPPEEVQQALETFGADPAKGTLTTNQIMAIGPRLDAQMILVVKLSGYGRIKKKWMFYLIGSGVVEGTVQGIAAAVVTSSTWAGIGLAAEEILQETLTWGGGTFLFNRIFTPVILDAELASTADGRIIWTDTTFARINSKGLKQLPEAERKMKEIRLRLTADAAAHELVVNLNKKAIQNIQLEQEDLPKRPSSDPAQ